MQIIEKDFTITYNGECWVLNFLKSKKELKENNKDSYKLGGYFTVLFYALIKVYLWRLDKKYPFKESAQDLKKILIQHKNITNRLEQMATLYEVDILKFKEQVFNEDRSLRSQLT